MTLDDYACFMHNLVVIVHVRNSESHVRNTNRCVPVKVANSAEKPVTSVRVLTVERPSYSVRWKHGPH
jgi:hypothetical protein